MRMWIVVAGSLLGAGLLQGSPSTPPVKMGLWETTSTTKMTMPDMPAGMPGMGPRTVKVHSCITPETWAKGLAAQQQRKDCVQSNVVQTPKTYSFDLTCGGGKQTGHFEMNFDSDTAAHGTMHLDIATGSHAASTDSTMQTAFLGADCGAVTPDKPQMVR